MKKTLTSVLATSLVLGSIVSTGYAASFTDIDNSYAKDAILRLQSQGILAGTSADHFNPQGTLTRAQFVTVIAKALGLDTSAQSSSFTDVEGWAIPYVEAAYKAGIIAGTSKDKFSPNAIVTREMAAVILVKALQTQGKLDDKDATLNFTDADSISDWAKPFIAIAQKYKLIAGNPDGSFNPQGTANREMAAAMGMNLLKAVDEVISAPVDEPDEPGEEPATPPVTGGGSWGGGGIYIPPTVNVSSITVTSEVYTIDTKGGTLQLSATVSPSNAANKGVTWSVSNDNATISDTGLLTAVKDGDVTVKATAADGSGVNGTKTITISNQTVVVTGPEAEEFVQPQDFGFAANSWSNDDGLQNGYNVGFKLDLTKFTDGYAGIQQIKVTLLDSSGNVLATKTADQSKIANLQRDYDTNNTGQLSTLFVDTDKYMLTDDWFVYTPYHMQQPSRAVIEVTAINGTKYIVENSNISPLPPVPDTTAPVIGEHPTYGLSAQAYDGFGSDPDGFGDYIDTFLSVNEPLSSLKVYAYAGDPENINTPVVEVTGSIGDGTAIGYSTNYKEANDIPGNESFPNSTEQLDAFFKTLNFAIEPKVVITATDLAGNVSTTTIPLVLSGINPQPSLYVEMQDFGPIDSGYNLGFKLNLDNLGGYDNIESITGIISDAGGEVSRVAADTAERIGNYATADGQYGDKIVDGQLSFDFRTQSYITAEYGGTEPTFTNYIKPISDDYAGTPTSATIIVVTKSGATITINHVYQQ